MSYNNNNSPYHRKADHESLLNPGNYRGADKGGATGSAPAMREFREDKGQLPTADVHLGTGMSMNSPQGAGRKMDTHITEAYKQFKHRISLEYKICDNPENKSIREIETLLDMKPGESSQFALDFSVRDGPSLEYKICDNPDNNSILEIETLLSLKPGESSQFAVDFRQWCATALTPVCCISFPYLIYYAKACKFVVPSNHFAIVEDHSGEMPRTELYGPGYHFLGLYRYYKATYSFQNRVVDNMIASPLGDLIIITVDQGTIALFEYNGQSKILGPGLHLIRDTVQFLKTIQLDNFYIKVGPEKWITIPDQYDGIAINNGKTEILSGGQQHHLFHENYKFAKLVPKIILTDRVVTDVCKYIDNLMKTRGALPVMEGNYLDPAIYLQTKTKDGAVIHLDTMLFWEIENTAKAAHKAMNVMELRKAADRGHIEDENVHIQSASRNIDNLRQTVLRFAKSCLAEAVGHVCLTDDDLFFRDKLKGAKPGTGTPGGRGRASETPVPAEDDKALVTMNFAIQNFLNSKTGDLVNDLNTDLHEYGVRVAKLTINNALPTREVQDQLDKQAKAKIDRNTALVVAETGRQVAEERMRTDRVTRCGEAKNQLEAAKIQRETMQTEAEGIADRERIIAQGKRDAAELQEATALGRQLALMESIGEASKAFNSGSGGKVYIVGSPMEAIMKVAGSIVPGLSADMSRGV